MRRQRDSDVAVLFMADCAAQVSSTGIRNTTSADNHVLLGPQAGRSWAGYADEHSDDLESSRERVPVRLTHCQDDTDSRSKKIAYKPRKRAPHDVRLRFHSAPPTCTKHHMSGSAGSPAAPPA